MTALPRAAAALVCAVAVVSLLLQFGLMLHAAEDTAPTWHLAVRFFSYFTVLSNLGVALATASVARRNRWPARFATPRALGAVALYIAVTGLVYATALRQLWQPEGLQWWVDRALHYVVPLLYLGWWLACVPHGKLGWRDLWRWLLIPAAFLSWTLLRDAAVDEYPYPFMDVSALGLGQVLVNALVVLGAFLGVAAVLLLFDRALARRHTAVADLGRR
ncbi:MAG: Pr6Pr family membrane protein [Lysobacter sp.]